MKYKGGVSLREIVIDLSQNSFSCPLLFCGYEGEHKNTKLSIILPSDLLPANIEKEIRYKFVFQTPIGELISSPYISADEITDNKISTILWGQLLKHRGDLIGCVAAVADLNGEEVELIAKTSSFKLKISDSPTGVDIIADTAENRDFISEVTKSYLDTVLNLFVDKDYVDTKLEEKVEEKFEAAFGEHDAFSNALKGSSSGAIVSIGDVSPLEHTMDVRVSRKNLLKTTNYSKGSLSEDGTIEHSTDTFCITSDFISLPKGTYIISYIKGAVGIDGAHLRKIAFFNSNKEFLRRISTSRQNNYKFTVNEGDAFIKIDAERSGIDGAVGYSSTPIIDYDTFYTDYKFQMEEGTVVTEYVPYVDDLSEVTVKQYGKNLLDGSLRTTPVTDVGLTIQYLADEDVYLLNGTTTTWGARYYMPPKIPSVKGQAYSLTVKSVSGSVTRPNGTEAAVFYLGVADDINTTGGNSTNWLNCGFFDNETRTNTKILEKNYITDSWFYASSGVSFNNYKVKIQVEFGDKATEYEPYRGYTGYPVVEDGVVNGVTSIYPTTTLVPDTNGVVINCTYNKDINKAPVSGGVPEELTNKVNKNTTDIVTNRNLIDLNARDISNLQAYLGYDDKDILGLEVDFEGRTFTRLAGAVGLNAGEDFNQFAMYRDRVRCNVADDGTIVAYYGDEKYRDDGSNGQVMVYQPKFYYRVVPTKLEKIEGGVGYHIKKANYYISAKPKPFFKLHPAFHNENGKPVEYILYGAYEGCVSDNKLCSVAGVKPTDNNTRFQCENLAKARGAGWHIETLQAISVNQLLFAIEYASFNAQEAVGSGITALKDDGASNCASFTGSTAHLGNNTGMAEKTVNEIGGVETVYTENGKVAVSYRGVENLWGNLYTHISNVNLWGDGTMLGGQLYVCEDFNININKHDGNYSPVGFLLPNYAGMKYISYFGFGNEPLDWVFTPSAVGSTSLLPVGDYILSLDNIKMHYGVVYGGRYDTGLGSGLFMLRICGGDIQLRDVTARLIFIPSAK